jgi:hypothetical protein
MSWQPASGGRVTLSVTDITDETAVAEWVDKVTNPDQGHHETAKQTENDLGGDCLCQGS